MLTKHVLVAILPFYIAAVNAANDWSKPCTSGVCEWDVDNGDTFGNIVVVSLFVPWTHGCFTFIPQCRPLRLLLYPILLQLQGGIFLIATRILSIHRPFALFANRRMRMKRVAMLSTKTVLRTLSFVCPTLAEVAPLLVLFVSGTPRTKAFQKRLAASSESVQQHLLGQSKMLSSISISLQCPPSKNGSAAPGAIAKGSTRNNVEMLATGSNNPAAPVREQAARIRRAHSSQKMRRGLGSRAPADVVSGFLNSKTTKLSEGSFLNRTLLELSDLNKSGVSTLGNSPIKVKKNIPIVENSKTCPATATTPALQGGFNMNVDVDIDARVSYGFAVEGQLVPPTIANVGFYTYASFLLRSTPIPIGFCPVTSVEMHPPSSMLWQVPKPNSTVDALRPAISPCPH